MNKIILGMINFLNFLFKNMLLTKYVKKNNRNIGQIKFTTKIINKNDFSMNDVYVFHLLNISM